MERFRFWLDEQWRRSEEERQRLAAVLAGLTEGIVLLDRYGRVLLSNDVARSLWPRLSPRVRGRHRIEIFGDAGCDRALSEALATGEPRQAELARPGPPSRRFRVRALPIPADQAPSLEAAAGAARGGGAAGAVVVVEDVTRQHALDQIRRDFVANVSHELQTPLTSVRGYAETLLADEALEEGQRQHFLRHILRESERMTSLVRDLLALAQLEAPRQVEAEPVDLAALVRTIVGAADGRARAQGLSLAYEADPAGEAGVVAGRAEELRRAIDNLVGNALAYTPAGGAIRVRVERRGAETAVSVSDTGIGIPAEAVPRIFERFYRVDRGRSRNTGGTGLGLAIVKHTAEGHGGRVEVASVPGQGSTFTLLLPAAPPGSPSPSALPPPGTRTG
jgi:two-component system phosphate regulon sensor histidine kinase PhoR